MTNVMITQPRGRILRWSLFAVALVAASALATAGAILASTTTHEASASRGEIYLSLDALLDDTSVVVEGRVVSQASDSISAEHADAPALPTTVSRFEVTDLTRPGGGAGSDEGGVAVGDLIDIVQMGSEESPLAGFPLLNPGAEYLVFLMPSEPGNPDGPQFFITGEVAGMYLAAGDGSFGRVVTDPDVLPERLTLESVREHRAD
jgi:hypothetical protein